ncbi:uncharacterized protein LOC128681630 isoform X2 [Plodia interpunctella]|nr:uncharacterized protein LOC128681630 isoform X2 [Plodia interpunctella]XP_053621636.1 uncharacterized protein LOC128681630 isoform X2 [Plodia interpunctella]
MLKIIKDIMLLEKNDPEKTNLLNEKERHKKKKPYSSSRSKTDYIVNRSCESSSCDRNRESQQIIENRQYDVHAVKTGQDKLKSPCGNAKRSKDTSSCGSCALKRLATSEYACLVCLGIVFVITIAVAFFMVFKTPPCLPGKKVTYKPNFKPGHRVFKGVNYADIPLKENMDEDSDWDDSHLGRISDVSALPGSDLDDPSSRILNFANSNNPYSDLSKIININKLNYGKSSERLKNFYKKLLRADDQIKNLKKGFSDTSITIKNSERIKRSLNHQSFHSEDNRRRRKRRHSRQKKNDSLRLPTTFVIEKKKLLVHYPRDERKKVPKCSHMPKESKSHETKLKHPFYKHTQRLDELLDQFIDKNLPKIMADPFNIDVYKTAEVKTTAHDKDTQTTSKSHKNVAIVKDTDYTRKPNDFFTITSADKSDSEVILGVTTIMSSPKHHQAKPQVDTHPNIRKLMQVYEQDDESVGYEDLKEVLADDESSEDPEVKLDRNKRSPDITTEPNPVFEFNKSNPAGIPIPNWKGPLPLYPDELNTMIKQENAHKATGSKNCRTPNKPMFTDIEYVEDYLTSKYEKLAQAYSDYGVLDEKKPLKIENQKAEKANVEHRVQYTMDPAVRNIRSSCNTSFVDLAKFLSDHIKFLEGSQGKNFNTASDDCKEGIHFGYFDRDLTKKTECATDAGKEGFHIGFIRHEKVKRNDKSVKPPAIQDNDTNTLANSVTLKKRTLKSITEIPSILKSNFLTIKVGSQVDPKVDDNSLFTIGYSFGENETEIKFRPPSKRSSVQTTLLNYLLGNHINLRSLKSIAIDDSNDKNESIFNITEDETTPMVPEYDKAMTANAPNETSTEEKCTKSNNNPEYNTQTNESIIGQLKIKGDPKPNVIASALNKSNIDLNINTDGKKSIMDIVNIVNSRNVTNKSDGMDLSDLFRMFSTWFSKLASVSLDNNDDQSGANSSIMVLKSSDVPDSSVAENSSDLVYPNYDSDMIDNIGHRSRVLMSIAEANNVTKNNKGHSETDDVKRESDIIIMNSTHLTNDAQTTSKYERDESSLKGDKRSPDNKTIVKRSLSDSGLVFWSDVYDDEYGVKVDPIDKEVERKARKGREFMRKSKIWIQDKVKSIAENIKEFRHDGVKKNNNDEGPMKVFKRHVQEDTDDTPEKMTSFADLKVKMRSVCKEAAKAVQQTRKMQVRESQEDAAANSILQQLVRMMSDLVDYQVKQKTCIKLPADLQNFLEWLTTPQNIPRRNTQDGDFLDEHSVLGKAKDWETPQTVTDEKAEYLDTLRAVEELIQQYGQMNDEEKSKMSGVRQYLESQQEFLTKQISLLDELHFSNIYGNQQPIRIRRNIREKTQDAKSNKERRLGKLGKFMKNYGTRNTITVIFDEATDNSKIEAREVDNIDDYDRNSDDINFAIESNNENTKINVQDYNMIGDFDTVVRDNKYIDKQFNVHSKVNKEDNDMNKRNLQDVYYRALNEAKKVTTEKNVGNTNYKLV